jgi:CubicO group peptidase (beta-lactamase class C family)
VSGGDVGIYSTDNYYAMGTGGQYIFVVPELALVTVITGDCDDTYAPWPYYTDYILAACE